MVELQDGSFQLQARTKLAKGGGSATIFVAAVAKEKDTSAVQVNLKDEGKLKKKKMKTGNFSMHCTFRQWKDNTPIDLPSTFFS